MAVSVSIEMITPTVAKNYLAKNMGNNRKINMARVSSMTKDMRDNLWVQNGDSIRFDTSGELIDGQHRLSAMAAAGKTIRTIVVRGLKPEVRTEIDGQGVRTPADKLYMSGIKENSALKASVSRLCFGLYSGMITKTTDTGSGNIRPNSADQISWVRDNSVELEHSIKVGNRLYKWWGGGSQAGMIFAHMALSRTDKEKADKFFDELCTGIGSGSAVGRGYDPRTALAKTVQDMRLSSTVRSGSAASYIYLITLAFNAWEANKFIPAIIPLKDKKTGSGLKLPDNLQKWWV